MTWRPNHPHYAHVHPLCWPVLWWSLHRFVAQLEVLMEMYGRDARIFWRVSWYGVIEIHEVRPVPVPSWRHVLADCRCVVEQACIEPLGWAEQLSELLKPVFEMDRTCQATCRACRPPADLDSS